MFDINETLSQMNVDDLKQRIVHLDLEAIGRPTRKDEFIRRIESQLKGNALHYRLLDQYGKLSISEFVHGGTEHFDIRQFKAKYGAKALVWVVADNEPVSRIRLFLYHPERHSRRRLVVPSDLCQRRLKMLPQPPADEMKTQSQLPDVIELHNREIQTCMPFQAQLRQRIAEFDGQRDLLSVLQLVETGALGMTPRTQKLAAASVKRIQKLLSSEEYYIDDDLQRRKFDEKIGPLRSGAWLWLLQFVKMMRNRGNRVELNKAGFKARIDNSIDSIRLIWRSWVINGSVDEFSRVNAAGSQTRKVKRYMTNPSVRRLSIELALKECPVGEWVRFNELSRYLRAMGLSLEITYDPWHLYVIDAEYGNLGYDGGRGCSLLQRRYMLCLLFEYEATPGLIDVAYIDPKISRNDFLCHWFSDDINFFIRYDGLQYFRLNTLGAYCLGFVVTCKSIVSEVEGPLSVLSGVAVRISDDFPQLDKLFLDIFAERQSDNILCPDSDKMLSALSSGRRIDDMRQFLETCDEQMSPDRVTGFPDQIRRRSEAIKMQGMALVIECAGTETANQPIADRQIKKDCELAGNANFWFPLLLRKNFARLHTNWDTSFRMPDDC